MAGDPGPREELRVVEFVVNVLLLQEMVFASHSFPTAEIIPTF